MNETAKRHILIVDDEPTIRLVFSYSLDQMGFLVETAANGFEAIAAVEKNNFDAVVMDINMPLITGIETCARISNRKAGSPPPIWLMTGGWTEETKLKGLAAGARGVLAKPFNCEQLVKRLEEGGMRKV